MPLGWSTVCFLIGNKYNSTGDTRFKKKSMLKLNNVKSR